MLKFIEQKWLYRLDRLQSHRLAPWVRRAHRRHMMIAILIGIILSALIVAVMLLQNRKPF